MADYLFMTNIGDDIVNTVTISKFTPSRKKDTCETLEFKVALYRQNKNEIIWKKLDEVNFVDNNITLRSDDYDLAVGELVVIIPMDVNTECKNELKSLPEPLSRRLDTSIVNERSSVAFMKNGQESSYQGEFPYIMSKIKGSFIAFDPLLDKQVATKLIFINIFSSELDVKEKFLLNYANAETHKVIKRVEYVHNMAAIIEIDCINSFSSVFYSRDTLGIPIFITYSEGTNISVEHTHPPSELYWGENKFYGQSLIKNNWFKTLP